MAEALNFPPFPPLEWDGWYWRAPLEVPWYSTAEKPQLIVRPNPKTATEMLDAGTAPRPTGPQEAAFRSLLDADTPLKRSMLPEFVEYVPELERPDWESVQAFFELASVLIFHPAADGVSYMGFVLNCLHYQYGYEHGVGIVTLKDRVVHFGMAEEAQDEGQALKDLRRIARAHREGK
jgi:hypothetical protein